MKFLQILAALENVEESILAAKIPFLSTGVGGTVLSVALLLESEVQATLQAISYLKNKPAAPVEPVSAPVAVAQ